MAITRKVNSGIKITKAHGDEGVFMCPPTRSEVRHVGEILASTKVIRTPRRLIFFSKPIPRRTKVVYLWLAYPPLHSRDGKLHKREARASSQSSAKRSLAPTPKPSRRLPSKKTSLRSPTRTNRNVDANTM
jgi:hypothetical protein